MSAFLRRICRRGWRPYNRVKPAKIVPTLRVGMLPVTLCVTLAQGLSVGTRSVPKGAPTQSVGAIKSEMQKSPRSFDLGLFHMYLVPRRRLNLEVMYQFLKGLVFFGFKRDTPGDTRCCLLGCFRPVSRWLKKLSKLVAPSPTNGNTILINAPPVQRNGHHHHSFEGIRS